MIKFQLCTKNNYPGKEHCDFNTANAVQIVFHTLLPGFRQAEIATINENGVFADNLISNCVPRRLLQVLRLNHEKSEQDNLLESSQLKLCEAEETSLQLLKQLERCEREKGDKEKEFKTTQVR